MLMGQLVVCDKSIKAGCKRDDGDINKIVSELFLLAVLGSAYCNPVKRVQIGTKGVPENECVGHFPYLGQLGGEVRPSENAICHLGCPARRRAPQTSWRPQEPGKN